MSNTLSDQSKIRILIAVCILLAIALAASISMDTDPSTLKGQVSSSQQEPPPEELSMAVEAGALEEVMDAVGIAIAINCMGLSGPQLVACILGTLEEILPYIPLPVPAGGIPPSTP